MATFSQSRKDAKRTQRSLFSPMHSGKILRIEELGIKWHVSLHVGGFFGGDDLAVNQKDDFRRNPASAQLLILIELLFLRLSPVTAGGTKHAHEVKVFLIDPELRRMQITSLCAHDVDRAVLPCIFAKDRKIKLESS